MNARTTLIVTGLAAVLAAPAVLGAPTIAAADTSLTAACRLKW